MPKGGTWGCLGESKTLAWGFAIVPHRLRSAHSSINLSSVGLICFNILTGIKYERSNVNIDLLDLLIVIVSLG